MMQWRDVPHKFSVNLWNFEVKAGKAAVEIFQSSFDVKQFMSVDSVPWKPRSKKSKGSHPLMVETGTLKGSIKWKHLGDKASPSGVSVYTDPKHFRNNKYHKGFCFAEIHNSPSPTVRRGRVAMMPQRQFMGHTKFLEDELYKLADVIFKGFPK